MNTYNYQTHSRTILGDLHTPVSTYLKVRDVFPQSALMESSDYHGSENNRSFIGLCPLASVSIDHGTAIFRLPDGTREERPIKAFIDPFPAGTLSGAPKVRAMQLISELEPHNRGAYGGCIGFIGLNGSLNQAITIRTFVSRNGVLWFQAGGGIVAKSNEEYELQEVNNKLGALKKAIVMAEKM